MQGIVVLDMFHFGLTYCLLIVVLLIMRYAKISQSKLLLVGSIRMTIQLMLAGYILEYIFTSKNPYLTLFFLLVMISFAIHRVISGRKDLNSQFKRIIAVSLGISGLFVLAFFVMVVVGTSFFKAQYTIPLAGMIIGNAMTGVNIGIKNFMETLEKDRAKLFSLLNLGLEPEEILKPIANNALETAMIPTLNNMVGMGIIFLPGMMTGQILSGTMPTTAILYQIAIMIAICTSVSLSVFLMLHFGKNTMFNKEKQFYTLLGKK